MITITCDKCGYELNDSHVVSKIRFEEGFKGMVVKRYEFDLCVNCYTEMLKDFGKEVEVDEFL